MESGKHQTDGLVAAFSASVWHGAHISLWPIILPIFPKRREKIEKVVRFGAFWCIKFVENRKRQIVKSLDNRSGERSETGNPV